MLTLYYMPGTCSLASHLTLAFAKANYRLERVDFGVNAQRSAEYLRVNPKGRVPALLTERGIITETPAILFYIAQSFQEARLAPLDDPFALAQMQSFNNYLCATVHVAHAHRVRGYRWVDENDKHAIEAMQRKVPQTMGDCFALIEREMFRGPWVMGDQFSVADLYLFTLTLWLEGDGVDYRQFHQVATHHQRLLDLPTVQSVLGAERQASR